MLAINRGHGLEITGRRRRTMSRIAPTPSAVSGTAQIAKSGMKRRALMAMMAVTTASAIEKRAALPHKTPISVNTTIHQKRPA